MKRTTVLATLAVWSIAAGAGTLDEPALQVVKTSSAPTGDTAPIRYIRKSVPPRSHEECLVDSQGIKDVVYQRCRYGYTLTAVVAEMAAQ